MLDFVAYEENCARVAAEEWREASAQGKVDVVEGSVYDHKPLVLSKGYLMSPVCQHLTPEDRILMVAR